MPCVECSCCVFVYMYIYKMQYTRSVCVCVYVNIHYIWKSQTEYVGCFLPVVKIHPFEYISSPPSPPTILPLIFSCFHITKWSVSVPRKDRYQKQWSLCRNNITVKSINNLMNTWVICLLLTSGSKKL